MVDSVEDCEWQVELNESWCKVICDKVEDIDVLRQLWMNAFDSCGCTAKL